jgi:hypothetical protein
MGLSWNSIHVVPWGDSRHDDGLPDTGKLKAVYSVTLKVVYKDSSRLFTRTAQGCLQGQLKAVYKGSSRLFIRAAQGCL